MAQGGGDEPNHQRNSGDLPAPLASYRNAHMAVPLPLLGVREYTHE